ncbi:MAG: PEP-CTERM sorting domain-containing protein [Verrucomicrobiota bacterium]
MGSTYTLISVVGTSACSVNWGLSAFTLDVDNPWPGILSLGANGLDLELLVVPEPATYAAIAGLLTLGFAALRRRQARRS